MMGIDCPAFESDARESSVAGELAVVELPEELDDGDSWGVWNDAVVASGESASASERAGGEAVAAKSSSIVNERPSTSAGGAGAGGGLGGVGTSVGEARSDDDWNSGQSTTLHQ